MAYKYIVYLFQWLKVPIAVSGHARSRIVAFWVNGLKDITDVKHTVNTRTKGSNWFFNKNWRILILVDWKNIEYNHGNHFNGSTFIAPFKGFYDFLLSADYVTRWSDPSVGSISRFSSVECFVNDIRTLVHSHSSGRTLVQSVLQLNANECIECILNYMALSTSLLIFIKIVIILKEDSFVSDCRMVPSFASNQWEADCTDN